MAFATVAELGNYLQTTIAADKTDSAQLALDLATALIKSDLGQEVEQGTSTETFAGNDSNVLVLKEIPVTAVTSVVYDGDTLTVDDDYTWTRAGIITKADGYYWREEAVVTYTHGYASGDVPTTMKAVCLSVAARYFDNPRGYDSKTGDNFTVSYFRSQGALSDAERRMLNPFRP
jgi:hypothetical protein